jgi:hypothetical protein
MQGRVSTVGCLPTALILGVPEIGRSASTQTVCYYLGVLPVVLGQILLLMPVVSLQILSPIPAASSHILLSIPVVHYRMCGWDGVCQMPDFWYPSMRAFGTRHPACDQVT